VEVGTSDVVVVVDEVPAEDIVDVAVAVVVDAVAGDLAGVDPGVEEEIGVGDLGAAVQHAHDDLRAPGGDGPGAQGIHVGAGGAPGLTRVAHVPLLGEGGVARRRSEVAADRVLLRELAQAGRAQQRDGEEGIGPRRQAQVVDAQAIGPQALHAAQDLAGPAGQLAHQGA
jgi:hypothetical protein